MHNSGTQMTLALMDYLLKNCRVECNNDYYILPAGNPDGLNHANVQPSWTKNMETFSNTNCKGVNLLNNFAGGNFDKGSNDPCSDEYRGPYPMSSAETSYQTVIKKDVKNIILSVTVTRLGAAITAPSAHAPGDHLRHARDLDYMEAFRKHAPTYRSGFYAQVHGEDHGHPMDYNSAKYDHSFNIAIESGPASDKHYHHNDIKRIFLNFSEGFFELVKKARMDQGFH